MTTAAPTAPITINVRTESGDGVSVEVVLLVVSEIEFIAVHVFDA